MPVPDRSYICDPVVEAENTVTFACSQDVDEWPWLALPPQHPIVIQTQNFWTSVGAGRALKSRDDDKWSALTWTRWTLGDRDAGIATRGTYTLKGEKGQIDFSTKLFDAQDRLITELDGKGVVFRTRDFESWREKSKQAVKEPTPSTLDYADAKRLGLSDVEPALIAPLAESDGTRQTTALITKANGLMPGHPYFSGSGDHVNAPHLAEVARQVASLASKDASLLPVGGEMDMHRYIELGTPFEIRIDGQSEESLSLAISQLGKSCARITLQWENLHS